MFGHLLRPPAWKRSVSIFWKVREEEEIEEKVRRIKKEEGKIQIGKVSKNKNTNRPDSHSAEVNKSIAGTLKLPTYLRSRSPHGALKWGTNSSNFVKITQGICGYHIPRFGKMSAKFSVFGVLRSTPLPNFTPSVQRVAPVGQKPHNGPMNNLNTGAFRWTQCCW